MKGNELTDMVELIKQSRKLLNITQHQLAEKSGLSYSTISKVEAGINDLTPETQNKIITVLTDEGFDIYTLVQLSQLVKKQGERRMAAINNTTINKPLTEQPFNEIKKQLILMEEALKRNQLNEPYQREDTVIKISEMMQLFNVKEFEYTVPNTSNINRIGGYTTLTHIVRQGKSKLIVALSELQTAIIKKQDENALKIIHNIKFNGMYQRKAQEVVSMWKQLTKPFETEYKNHKVK